MRILALLAVAILFVTPTQAAELGVPKGEIVLTVTGAIENTNAGETAVFDMEMLDALAARTTRSTTPWYDGEVTFSGPLGSAILEAVGAKGSALTVTAINDYSAEIPVEDFTRYPVILANRLDGALMSVREKGPLFVIYPFDVAPELVNEVYFTRSVWQVKSINVH